MTILLFMSLHLRISREILEGVYQGARERRWNVQQFESVPPPDELRQVVDFWKPDGCLVYAEDGRNPLPQSFPRDIPVVTLSDRHPNRNTVNQDVGMTVRLALDELVQAGARNFAYVGPKRQAHWNQVRRAAFLAQARQRGFPARSFSFDPQTTGDSEIRDFIAGLPTPAGVLIAADPFASRVIHAANLARVRIPADVAFVSVDNDAFVCDNLRPTLTSVIIDFKTAGRRMISLLDEVIRDSGKSPRSAVFGPSGIRRRESTLVKRFHPLVEKALAFIRREAASPIGVEEVAAAIGLTRRSAQRLFAAKANVTIADAIRTARVDRAKTALSETDDPIEIVAGTCGFQSAAHLKIVFRKTTGLTMRAYRLSARGNKSRA